MKQIEQLCDVMTKGSEPSFENFSGVPQLDKLNSASHEADTMSDATVMLAAIKAGDPKAAEVLLVLVYDELRRLAASKLAREAEHRVA